MTTATKPRTRKNASAKAVKPRVEIEWTELLNVALTSPGNIGNTYSRFYSYSFMNQIWLMMQGVMEPCATFKRWQGVDRQVLKGSKAKSILRPITITRKNDMGEVESAFTGFRVVNCIFGYSETDGAPLAPMPDLPEWELQRALKALEIGQVPFTLLDGNTQGYSFDRQFALNPVASEPLKTTVHELAHIVCGHTKGELAGHRGLREFQAEATAFLVLNELQLLGEDLASQCRGYIQHWLRGVDAPSDAAIRKVFTATNAILKAGRPVAESPERVS